MASPSIIAIVLAGGEGTRLHPLTNLRSKPAVPFAGRHRIVDFVLSNFVNSHIYSIYLLVQYKSQSLIEHISEAWRLSPLLPGHFVTVVPPQKLRGSEWFEGTADAVYQNLNLIRKHRPDLVAVFGADHVYRMDVRQMIDFHREKQADVTVAALPVPLEKASAFGVIDADSTCRIQGFVEKPAQPPRMPNDKTRAYASMGNYLFDSTVLREVLEDAHLRGEKDFGTDILPRLVGTHRLFAYDFLTNVVPGVKPYEESHYWRDIGTIGAYWQAHSDILGAQPAFDLFNARWPIHCGSYNGPAAKILDGEVRNTLVGEGTLIQGASVRDSVLRREVVVEKGVELEDCIVMDYCVIGAGSRLRKVIVDRYNVIPPNTVIGFNRKADSERYCVDGSGIVIVPVGTRELDLVY